MGEPLAGIDALSSGIGVKGKGGWLAQVGVGTS
jgi:hypothetical protein